MGITLNKKASVPSNSVRKLYDLYASGDYVLCINFANALLKEFDTSLSILKILGAALAHEHRFDEAITIFVSILNFEGANAETFNNLGLVYFRKGDSDTAIKYYLKSLELETGYVDARKNIARAYLNKKDPQSAIEHFTLAIESKPNDLQLLSQLTELHTSLGNLSEAIKIVQLGLKHSDDLPSILVLQGTVYQKFGKFEQVIEVLQKCVKLYPNFVEGYLQLALTFMQLHEYHRTIQILQEADKKCGPTDRVLNLLGIVHEEIGDYEQAMTYFMLSLELNADNHNTLNNIGLHFLKIGNPGEALSYFCKSLSVRGENNEALQYFGSLMTTDSNLSLKKEWGQYLYMLLSGTNVMRPRDIASTIIKYCYEHNALNELLDEALQVENSAGFKAIINKFNQQYFLINLMKVTPIPDLKIERALGQLRKFILLNIDNLDPTNLFSTFTEALAIQCFINEHIYHLTYSESVALEKLRSKCHERSRRSEPLLEHELLCLAYYLDVAEFINEIPDPKHGKLQNLVQLTYTNYYLEKDIKKSIKSVSNIYDSTSQIVRDQYEQNPYPRWIKTYYRNKPLSLMQMAEQLDLNVENSSVFQRKTLDILVAGCGTGQHSISTSKRFNECRVKAIDLSRSSLAYAIRKTQEQRIDNIEYLHGDILEISDTWHEFDVIESVGVLHHMKDPLLGWAHLIKLLKPGGLMKIGLYSVHARKIVSELRSEFQNRRNISPHDIRATRTKILAGERIQHKAISQMNEFYSMSEFRDLILHEEEHTYNLFQIENMLNDLGLIFCGFEGIQQKKIFKKHYPKSNLSELAKWNTLEEKQPSLFSGMYQFWCQKI